jgi:hypothetical protein
VFTEIDKGIRGSDIGTNHDSIGIKVCHECQSQIKDDEPYVCFKIPAKTDWILFYNRRPGSDCWETYLRKAADHQRDGNHGKRAQEPGRPLMAPPWELPKCATNPHQELAAGRPNRQA